MGTDRSALAALGATLALIVVLLATTAGGLRPVHVAGTHPSKSTASTSSRGGSGQREGSPTGSGSTSRPSDTSWLPSVPESALILVLAGGVLAALLTVRISLVRRRPIVPHRTRAVSADAASDDEETGETLQSVLDEQLLLLDVGTPRNAIVAAWVQLEDFAARRGLPREPADTPSEFVARALGAYDLDTAALERLADLYREARFSRHALEERHRAEARACLERLTGAEALR